MYLGGGNVDEEDIFMTAVAYIGKNAVLANTYIVGKGDNKDKVEVIRKMKLMNHSVDRIVLHELKSINFQREGIYKV